MIEKIKVKAMLRGKIYYFARWGYCYDKSIKCYNDGNFKKAEYWSNKASKYLKKYREAVSKYFKVAL